MIRTPITPKRQCDVAILGGGPAGTATALSLLKNDPSLQVVVIERSGYDRLGIGETLPPDVRPVLEQLDVWPDFIQAGHLAAYGTCAAWGSPAIHANETVFNLHGNGWHLDRCAFDALLAQNCEERGAIVYEYTRLLNFQRFPDQSWDLILCTQQNTLVCLNSRFVVDATGRLASFSRRQGAQRTIYDHLTGVAVLFKASPDMLDTYALVEAGPSGWWYSAILPSSRMIVMYMSDNGIIKQLQMRDPTNWFEQVRKTEHTMARLRRAEPLMRPFTLAAHTQGIHPIVGMQWLAAGDAASTFDPLSGQGIYKALLSGIFASYAILDYFKGQLAGLERYASLQQAEFRQYLAAWNHYYTLEQRWAENRFWKYRHESVWEDSLVTTS